MDSDDLPANINRYKEICKDCVRGYSQTVRHKSVNLTFWKFPNASVLIDNDFPAGEDNWDLIEIRSSGGN